MRATEIVVEILMLSLSKHEDFEPSGRFATLPEGRTRLSIGSSPRRYRVPGKLFSFSAIRARSTKDAALIFRMTLPR